MIITFHVSLHYQKTDDRFQTTSLKPCRSQFFCSRHNRLPRHAASGHNETVRNAHHPRSPAAPTSFPATTRPTTHFRELKWCTDAQNSYCVIRIGDSPTSLRCCFPRANLGETPSVNLGETQVRATSETMTYSICNGKVGQFGHRQQTRGRTPDASSGADPPLHPAGTVWLINRPGHDADWPLTFIKRNDQYFTFQ